ncbi:MAG: FHA domain-containing protein [Anaeromyxobacter sp.]|nr:FHA domain-containing protein [Anaeromyxobacter sp.]MBL0276078.1 FHA domain-containing protein [Anaeromyxobacter sp.]
MSEGGGEDEGGAELGIEAPAPVAGATRVAAGVLLRWALGGGSAPVAPHLVVLARGGGERSVALAEELIVGRDHGAGLRLADPGVSRRHARLRLGEAGQATVEDLGSKNGVVLNGARLASGAVALRPGDRLVLGGTELRFVDPVEALVHGAGELAPGLVVEAGAPAAASTPAEDHAPAPGPPHRAVHAWALLAAASLLLAGASAGLAAW